MLELCRVFRQSHLRRGATVVAGLTTLAILLTLVSGGCVGTAGSASPTVMTATRPTLSPAASPPSTPVIASPTPGRPQTLTIWITEFVAPLEGGEVTETFARQIAAFEATHPGLTIQVIYKKPSGKGGMEDFLAAAAAVAPAVVPDLVVLDFRDLPTVARKGLLVPLDDLLSPRLQDDLYPFALQAGTVDGRLMGVPFEVDIEHAIYNTAKIAVPPITWSEVFSSGATYIFPTLGQDGLVNDAFLIQYLSTGATLVDDGGNPALDPQALTDVLAFYRQGIESGAILTDVLQYATVENCWPKYLQAQVVMSNISSNLYLTGRGLLTVSRATYVPTRDGRAIALGRGHVWALTSRDQDRRRVAVRLLEWLLYPPNMAAWNLAAGHLPTRRAALEEMGRDQYFVFVHAQLENTVPYPDSEVHRRIYRAMQQAVDAVLRKGAMPQAAADDVLRAVNQERSQ